jgi:hypothetical protein
MPNDRQSCPASDEESGVRSRTGLMDRNAITHTSVRAIISAPKADFKPCIRYFYYEIITQRRKSDATDHTRILKLSIPCQSNAIEFTT